VRRTYQEPSATLAVTASSIACIHYIAQGVTPARRTGAVLADDSLVRFLVLFNETGHVALGAAVLLIGIETVFLAVIRTVLLNTESERRDPQAGAVPMGGCFRR
jgi:hypothetical protein